MIPLVFPSAKPRLGNFEGKLFYIPSNYEDKNVICVVRDSSLQPMFLKYSTGHFHDDKKIQDMPNSVAAENDLTPCFQNSD